VCLNKVYKAYLYAVEIHINWSGVEFQADHAKAMFIIYGCKYIIVDGHHRVHALRQMQSHKIQGLAEVVSDCAEYLPF
jgi:hypothetical protein